MADPAAAGGDAAPTFAGDFAASARSGVPLIVVRDAVARALAEDLMPLGDLTSSLLPAGQETIASIVPRVDGVLAGRACVDEVFRQVDPSVELQWFGDDGMRLVGGEVAGMVRGALSSILTAERTALNFLGHLSGIATLTRRFVDEIEATGSATRVWDTRKTTPGLRSLEKAAVRAGGGANHRGNLSEWVMFKDNHLALLGIAEAVRRARATWPGRTVHVECDRLDQVEAALTAGADAILLDNMTYDEVSTAVELARKSAEAAGRPRPLLEVSGGVTLETVAGYAETGVDLVSVGGLTNSAPVLDIGLDIGP